MEIKINKNKVQCKLSDEIDKMQSGLGKNEVSFGLVGFRILPEIGSSKMFCHVHRPTPSLLCTDNKKISKKTPSSFLACPSHNETYFQA